jgi:hypothetical protein
MKNLKKLNNNQLSELCSLVVSIDAEIEAYRHVSNHLPSSIQTTLTNLYESIIKETNKRENINT